MPLSRIRSRRNCRNGSGIREGTSLGVESLTSPYAPRPPEAHRVLRLVASSTRVTLRWARSCTPHRSELATTHVCRDPSRRHRQPRQEPMRHLRPDRGPHPPCDLDTVVPVVRLARSRWAARPRLRALRIRPASNSDDGRSSRSGRRPAARSPGRPGGVQGAARRGRDQRPTPARREPSHRGDDPQRVGHRHAHHHGDPPAHADQPDEAVREGAIGALAGSDASDGRGVHAWPRSGV